MPNVCPNLLSSFINTTAGWINILLLVLLSSGPVKILVGAAVNVCHSELSFDIVVLLNH